ncbi:MAG: NADH-quinone oxidoreductase subunit J [Fimbriimonadaceae bacterium]
MSPGQIVFLVLATIAVFSAIGVVFFGDQPVRSALSLVLNFFILAFLYFTLGAQLLGITQILVYAGAIMVLFLFVIMILRQFTPIEARQRAADPKRFVAVIFGVALVALILQQVVLPLSTMQDSVVKVSDSYGLPQAIGRELFTTYVWPFEITSVLLLVGIVGSILLAKRKLQ